jgi:hypothetical protein
MDAPYLVRPALLGPLAIQVLQVLLEYLGQRRIRVRQVLLDAQDLLVYRDFKVSRVRKVLKDIRVLLEQQDRLVIQGPPVQQPTQAQLVILAHRDNC